jgi:ComF family protein
MTENYLPVGVSKIRDYVFPVFCFGCSREGSSVCPACLRTAPPIALQRCLACLSIHAGGALCSAGRKKFALDHLVSRGLFHEWFWQPILHTWKYNGARELGTLVTKFMTELNNFVSWPVEYIIPVPLSRRRFNDRGFNQAAILAEALSRKLSVPVLNAFKRKNDKSPQASLPVASRRENIRGAFEFLQMDRIKHKNLLIVDDVVTTGTTLAELALALKKAGAHSVSAITLLTATDPAR